MRSVRRFAATQKAVVSILHVRSSWGVTRGHAPRWIVRMEMPKAYARAAADAPVHASGAFPIVVQDLSCADARVAGA